MTAEDNIKKIVGARAAELVMMDMIIGIGTGSTAYWFMEALSQRIKKGLKCVGVPTSRQSADLATDLEIPLIDLNDVSGIDLVIDGTDELDHKLCLIKGGGGALLQEKMVAAASKHYIIIADHTKLVDHLGTFPLPVEVIPYGWKHVQQRIIHSYNIEVRLRIKSGKPFLTDHGHYILDCFFGLIHNASLLNSSLKNIPGIVEDGLFINMANEALIGMPDGNIRTIKSI